MNLFPVVTAALLLGAAVPGFAYFTNMAEATPELLDGAAGAADEDEPRTERQVVDMRIETAVAAPWPTCPLDCTMGYSMDGYSVHEFVVEESAQRIEIVARWDPSTPLTERLRVSLSEPWEECESCWMGVAGADGSREVRFAYDSPTAGPYTVWLGLSGPGAGVKQDVEVEILVHHS